MIILIVIVVSVLSGAAGAYAMEMYFTWQADRRLYDTEIDDNYKRPSRFREWLDEYQENK